MKHIVMAGVTDRCFSACVAMVTGLDYATIPDFCASEKTWLSDARLWLAARGWSLVYIERRAVRKNLACLGDLGQGAAPVILSGPNRRGVMHAIVMHAGKVLDPDPGACGIVDWRDAIVLVPAAS